MQHRKAQGQELGTSCNGDGLPLHSSELRTDQNIQHEFELNFVTLVFTLYFTHLI